LACHQRRVFPALAAIRPRDIVKHNIYLFSGLGADERVFKNLRFPESQVRHIRWPTVTPQTLREDFLGEIKAQITTNRNNVFLGVSFGGLIAQDIAASLSPDILIIVSSVINQSEIPKLYRGGLARIALKLTPNFFLNKPNVLINYMFSVATDEGRKTLHDIIRDTDPTFFRWAVKYLQHWKGTNQPASKRFYRIHGSNDRVFPSVLPNSPVEFIAGGHFAIYEAAAEVNYCLKSWL
jgi:pimeloyl-ACP methyl ester carboxylesterase